MEGRLKSWACGDRDVFLGSVTLESATKAERSSWGSRDVSVLVKGTREARQCGAVRGCAGLAGAGWLSGTRVELWSCVGGRAGVLWSFRVRQGRLIPGGSCEVPLAELGCENTRDRNGSHK